MFCASPSAEAFRVLRFFLFPVEHPLFRFSPLLLCTEQSWQRAMLRRASRFAASALATLEVREKTFIESLFQSMLLLSRCRSSAAALASPFFPTGGAAVDTDSTLSGRRACRIPPAEAEISTFPRRGLAPLKGVASALPCRHRSVRSMANCWALEEGRSVSPLGVGDAFVSCPRPLLAPRDEAEFSLPVLG